MRTSSRALGAADVWRDCVVGDQTKVFPSTSDGIKPLADQSADFVDTVAAAHADADDGKLSLELWTPNCSECGNKAYWARYYTKEADSVAVRPRLVVTYEASTAVANVSLTADDPTPEAGAAEVPLDAVPPSAILDASKIVAAPLSDTPLSDTPLSDTPLADIPLSDIGFGDVAALLKTVPLSTLPLRRDGGWPAFLERLDAAFPASPTVQALVDRQLQQITLGDLYSLTPLPPELDGAGTDDITLSELDLTNSPLGDLNTLDVILGSTPLSQVNIPDSTPGTPTTSALDAWCELLAAPPISCVPGTGGTALAGATIISTALRGAPLADTPLADTPLSDIPLSDIPLADTPLSDTPLADIPLSDTGLTGIPLADTPLSDIPLSDIPLSDTPLSDTPLADTPLADTPLADTPLADIDLERFPLSDTPLADTPLADTPLADTPLADTPLADVPLSDIDIALFPLSDTPLADVPLSDTPLADIPLSDVANPSAIVVGTCNATTLGGCTLQPGLDYGDVLRALSPSARILVNELVAAFADADALTGRHAR